MDLTLREEYWKKFCMKLITVITHDNYCSQFYHRSCKLVQCTLYLLNNGA
jgi:hypothetical protein